MPDSYGKRQRNTQKAKKFAAREERRAARKQQKADEAAGIFRPAEGAEGEAPEQTDELTSTEGEPTPADAEPGGMATEGAPEPPPA